MRVDVRLRVMRELSRRMAVVLVAIGIAGAAACGDDDGSSRDAGDRDASSPPLDALVPPPSTRDGAPPTRDSGGFVVPPTPPIDGGAGEASMSPPPTPPVPPPPPDGDPMFVAVGYGGHRTRSIDGRAWTDHLVEDPMGGDDPRLLRGVGYGDGDFVAVGNRILVSRDGAEWTETAYTPGSFLSDAVWMDGTWVAAGGNGLRVRSVGGSASWGDETEYYAGHYRAIAAGNGRFVAVGHTYGDSMVGLVSFTTDGATWSDEHTGGAPFRSIAFGAGVFVAVGDEGRAITTPDGETITELDLGADSLDDVAFVNGELVILGSDSIWRSRDGIEWLRTEGHVPSGLEHGLDVYVGTEWPGRILASSDLTRFDTVSDTGPGLTDIVFGYVLR